MQQFTALLDANILYAAPLRDVFLELAVRDLYRARWTETIQKEWINARLRNDSCLDRHALEKLRKLMEVKTPNALITNYESWIERLYLPDPDDRHALAAAIVGDCDVIVTQNLRDFPQEALSPHGIMAQHPDKFLLKLAELYPREVCAALRVILARLKNPSYSVDQYLANLSKLGLCETTSKLQQYADLLK